jgi:DNA-binding transcriptional LysR family regulator
LKEFRRVHPGVDVKLTTGATPRLIRQLRTGGADLGLLTLPIDDPSLATESVIREELLLITAPQHPLARKRQITPQDLLRQPFVLFEPGSNSRRVIEEFFVREQIEPKVVTETENVEIIKALVRVRMGIAIVPYQAIAREVSAGQLFCARIAGQKLFRETGWVHPRANRLPRAVQEMRRILEELRPRLKLHPGE